MTIKLNLATFQRSSTAPGIFVDRFILCNVQSHTQSKVERIYAKIGLNTLWTIAVVKWTDCLLLL